VDLNGDGSADILSGSYSRQQRDMAGLFQVLSGQPNGTFKKAEVLKGTDNEPLIIPIKNETEMTENICTRPVAVDWTGNGKLDLIVGNFSGTFYRFIGEGNGRFNPKPELLKAIDNSTLRIAGAHSDPFVVDWDGDGDLDIVSGLSNGGVQWVENIGGKVPQFRNFRHLIPAGPAPEDGKLLSEEDLTGPTTSTRVWVADVNNDGKLDLLVGDSVTLISTAKGVSKTDFPKRYAKWKAALDKAQEKEGGFSQTVYDQRKEFMVDEMTGYVWAYLRK